MTITDTGVGIRIGIWLEDSKRLNDLKLTPEETTFSVVNRVLDEHAEYKKLVQSGAFL